MANSGMKILGGLIVGTAIGAVVGLLTAPDSGKKTRKKLDKETKKLSKDLSNNVDKKLKSLKTSYQDIIDSAVSKTQSSLDKAKNAVSADKKA